MCCRSFYVCKAAGREGDLGVTDIKFAEVFDCVSKIVIKTRFTNVQEFFFFYPSFLMFLLFPESGNFLDLASFHNLFFSSITKRENICVPQPFEVLFS